MSNTDKETNRTENGFVTIQTPLSGSNLLKILFAGNQEVTSLAARNLLKNDNESSGITYLPGDIMGNNHSIVWAASSDEGVKVGIYTELIMDEAHAAYAEAVEFIVANTVQREISTD